MGLKHNLMLKVKLCPNEAKSVSDILTRQFVEGVLGTVHVYDPSSGVVAIMSAQDEPLLIEYSIRTLPLVPEDVHVMF